MLNKDGALAPEGSIKTMKLKTSFIQKTYKIKFIKNAH